MSTGQDIRARAKRVFAEYAGTAAAVHVAHGWLFIFGGGFLVGCQAGADAYGEWAAAISAAWVTTQALQLPRLALTAALTPLLVRGWRYAAKRIAERP